MNNFGNDIISDGLDFNLKILRLSFWFLFIPFSTQEAQNVIGCGHTAVEEIAVRTFQQSPEKTPLEFHPFGCRDQEVWIIKGLALRGAGLSSCA